MIEPPPIFGDSATREVQFYHVLTSVLETCHQWFEKAINFVATGHYVHTGGSTQRTALLPTGDHEA